MRLAIDARSLLPVQPGLGPTGVGRWTAGVVKGLASVAPDWHIELVLVHDRATIDPTPFGPNVSFQRIDFSERWQRRLGVIGLWPRIDRFIGRPDALLGPGFVTWRTAGAAMPVVHDLTHVRFPEMMSPRNLWFMRLMLGRSLERARVVVTVSEAIKDEISEHYGLDPERIAVVPNGCDAAAIEATTSATLPSGVPDRFLLSVGTLEPRKNLLRVLEAYEMARREAAGDFPALVVAGGRGWRDAGIAQAFERIPEGAVVPLGYVDDASLFSLYRRAVALVFPSLYEGFGLPVLEAMASGCPVITARVGGIPEVAGDAALFVDPLVPSDIAAGMRSLVADETLRTELGDRGRHRARSFTWEAAGRALKETVETAMA